MARQNKRRRSEPRRRRKPKQEEPKRNQTGARDDEPRPSSLPEDEVAEASLESFPASDAPAWSRRSPNRDAEQRE